MKYKKNDYIIYCQICGKPCYFSESVKLGTYTGRGGLRVCPLDADPIDYGLVPYSPRPEKPVPEAVPNHYASNRDEIPNAAEPIDTETTDPMST